MSDCNREKIFDKNVLGNTRNVSSLSRSREDYLFKCLSDVNDALSDRGYDAVNQIVGYLVSGDPVYITSYKGARKSISQFSREEILKFLLKECLK